MRPLLLNHFQVCSLAEFIIMDQANTVVIILASANLRQIPSVISLWPFFFYNLRRVWKQLLHDNLFHQHCSYFLRNWNYRKRTCVISVYLCVPSSAAPLCWQKRQPLCDWPWVIDRRVLSVLIDTILLLLLCYWPVMDGCRLALTPPKTTV